MEEIDLTENTGEDDSLVITLPVEAWAEFLQSRHMEIEEMEAEADLEGDQEAANAFMAQRQALAAEWRHGPVAEALEGEEDAIVRLNLRDVLDRVPVDLLPLIKPGDEAESQEG